MQSKKKKEIHCQHFNHGDAQSWNETTNLR